MSNKIFHAVILGAPASGKGTIAKRIVTEMNFEHISPGDLVRQSIANNTDLGKEAKEYAQKGQLVPDEVIIKSVLDHIKKVGCKSWILDGFPRTLAQAQCLCNCEKIDVVFNLKVPHDLIIERVKGRWIHLSSGRVYNDAFKKPKVPGKDDVTGEDLVKRDDDKPEVVAKRLKEYDGIIQPVIAFYEKQKLVKNIDGNKNADIWGQVEACITQKLNCK